MSNSKIKIFGIYSENKNECFVIGSFYNRCPSDKSILERMLKFIEYQDSIGELEIFANDGENLIVRFWTVGTHEPDIVLHLLLLFPEIDMRFSTFTADGDREDLVRLIDGPIESIRYPRYLEFNVVDMDARR